MQVHQGYVCKVPCTKAMTLDGSKCMELHALAV